MLDALSPLKVLDRGYAMATQKEGKALRSVNDVKVGDEVKLRLSDGELSARILGSTI